MPRWELVFAYALDVFLISLPLAIFEIVLERQYGWGGRLNPKGWGKKLFAGTVLSEICEKLYLTPYHIFVFAFVVPGILVAELWLAQYAGLVHSDGWSTVVQAPGFMHGGELRLIPVLFLTSVWLSVLVVEDALWFALNWHYPKSWSDLLSGKIWWHTKWITLGSIKLPRFYLTTEAIAAVVLLAGIYESGH